MVRCRGYRMHIIVKCPHCGCRSRLDAAAADRRLRCRKCLTLLKIPDLTEVPNATTIIDVANTDVYVDDAGRTYG